jgi:hypothetical protein
MNGAAPLRTGAVRILFVWHLFSQCHFWQMWIDLLSAVEPLSIVPKVTPGDEA